MNTCTCKIPSISCSNAMPKVIGHYCKLDFPSKREIEIGKLKNGDNFSFIETPWLINTVLGQFTEGTKYQRPCEWKQTEPNYTRIVNIV